MTSDSPYVFFFPYRGVGGVPVLFLRIANYLSEKRGMITYVVDYSDGYMARNPRNPNVRLIPYEDDQPVQIPPSSLLIFQSELPWGLPRNLVTDASTRLFFWNCYPFNFIPVFPGRIKEWTSRSLARTRLTLNTVLYPSKRKCIALVRSALKNHAVVFMDAPNLNTTTHCLGISIPDPVYLPILVQDTPARTEATGLSADPQVPIRAAWLGRIADFKVHSLLRAATDLKALSQSLGRKIILRIIGSGNKEEFLKARLSETEFFQLEFIAQIPTHELDAYLSKNVDVLFAMGTSALEGAKLGIPTLLMDFAYQPISDRYRYHFTFEARDFSLGDLISKRNESQGRSLPEIFALLESSYGEISRKSGEHFHSHHSLESNIDLFLSLSSRSSLIYSDLLQRKFTQRPSFYAVWAWIKALRRGFA